MSKGHRAKVMGHPPTGPIKVMLIPRGCHPQVGWSLSVLGQWEAESVLTVKGSGQGFLPYSLLQAESPALGVSPPLLQPLLVTVLPLLLDGPESSLRYHCLLLYFPIPCENSFLLLLISKLSYHPRWVSQMSYVCNPFPKLNSLHLAI